MAKNMAVADEVDRLIDEYSNRGLAVVPTADEKAPSDSGFPAPYFVGSKAQQTRIDTMDAVASEVGGRNLGDKVRTMRPITDDDVQSYLYEKKANFRYDFDGWFSEHFDWNDPNKLHLMQKLHPGFFAERAQEIQRQAAIQQKFAMMKLYGPQDIRDYMFLYGVSRGDIEIPTGELWKGRTYTDDQFKSQYRKGMFAVTKLFNGSATDTIFNPYKLGEAKVARPDGWKNHGKRPQLLRPRSSTGFGASTQTRNFRGPARLIAAPVEEGGE